MKERRLEEILGRFAELRILVVGDFFLDQYLEIDPDLAEISLETGLEAHQVVAVRNSPGAAGTVCSNLAALGVGVRALGIIGRDGNGLELLKGLQDRGVDTGLMVETLERYTPAYLKPMRRTPGGAEEMNRLDIKNRTPTPEALQEEVITRFGSALEGVQGVIIADQVEEDDHGVITSAVRSELERLARAHEEKIFLADSRAHIGAFQDVIIKPNEKEGMAAVRARGLDDPEYEELLGALFSQTRKPVFLTCGERGIYVYDGVNIIHCPAIPVCGPIDIVGAGDSASAGIVSALCAGANLEEAALVGNLCASVTIRKIGVTGTASPEEIRESFGRLQK
ncbi:MAG TPA: PfkB family carbohydrate kinase [Acidobacteriota bacterium]|nr:PfkB family carbohydrate kinase [Acidobacteriota bacterium]